MTVYVGPTAGNWELDIAPDVSWMYVAPLPAELTYPLVFDVAESAAMVAADNELVVSFRQALAPTWEDFAPYHNMSAGPNWQDVSIEADNGVERYLLGAAARVTASLGPRLGIVLDNPQRYDDGAAFFMRCLLQEARSTGFNIALKAHPSVAAHIQCQIEATAVDIGAPHPRNERTVDPSRLGNRLLACCPQGAPVNVLEALDVPREDLEGLTHPGPCNTDWACLPMIVQQHIAAKLAFPKRQEYHRLLFDAWPPTGWGYLRRAALAIVAQDTSRLLAQHAYYLHGSLGIGRSFLYQHYATLARSLIREDSSSPYLVPAHTCAARLTPWLGKVVGAKMATYHYESALRRVTDPAEECSLVYEYANSYATQRRSNALRIARRIYERGFETLGRVKSPEDHLRLQITLLNGLALVEYHEGHNDKALALERQAQDIALGANDFPHIEKWATTLLNINIAKLLEKRFGDVPGAIAQLQQTIEQTDGEAREKICGDLACLHFDQGDYPALVAVLSDVYEQGSTTIIDERRELFGRLMFTLSLLALGERRRAQRQLKRLSELSQRVGSDNAPKLVDALSRACAVGACSVRERVGPGGAQSASPMGTTGYF